MVSHFDAADETINTLFSKINELRETLNKHTMGKYKRINPLNENLIDWKDKGRQISGHDNNTIYESSTIIGAVEMGNNCWIGPFTILDGSGGLCIGDFVTVAAGSMIFTHDTYKFTLTGGLCPCEYKSVTIGNNCFVGTHAILLKGTSIGHHSLIQANSLVSGEFPPYSIVAGSPAVVIGKVQVDGENVSLEYIKKDKRSKKWEK